LLWFFERAAKKKTNGSKYQFWQHHNQSIELWTDAVIKQKIDYIHNNPVESGLVTDPTHWKYSSARNFRDDHSVLEIDDTGFFGLSICLLLPPLSWSGYRSFLICLAH
jgi:hypothetical protein